MIQRLLTAVFVLLSVGVGVLWAEGRAEADRGAEEPLPVTRVVLFTTGVGYFERSGTISGTDTVDLVVDTDSVNDLMKSLVARDDGGGTVSWVSYSSYEPNRKEGPAPAVDFSNNPSLLAVLSDLSGTALTLDLSDGGSVAGTLIGVSRTDSGASVNLVDRRNRLRRIEAARVIAVGSDDPEVVREIDRALARLERSRYQDSRRASIRCEGSGDRRVTIGYILEAPVWKTAYRLLLGGDDPMLQGWAVVENRTRGDWRDVSMSLVSGSPISFTMDLYRPITVSRPEVEPEVALPIAPPSYETAKQTHAAPSPEEPAAAFRAPTRDGLARAGGAVVSEGSRVPTTRLDEGVGSQATGAATGEFFEYRVDTPVSLATDESAMVPIIAHPIKAERISIFNSSSHPSRPFHSVRLHNTTDLVISNGPVTVYDSGSYAGESTVDTLRPDARTYLSYAIDLESRLSITRTAEEERVIDTKIEEGLLRADYRAARSVAYRIAWSHQDDRRLMIEHAARPGWELVMPAADEMTESYYRFLLTPSADDEVVVTEERVRTSTLDLANASDRTIGTYVDDPDVRPEVREGLRGILVRREVISETQRQIRELQNRRNEIVRDQQRIRENIEKVDEESDIYRRYLDRLSEQEDEIARIAERREELEETERRLRTELEEYIENLQAG